MDSWYRGDDTADGVLFIHIHIETVLQSLFSLKKLFWVPSLVFFMRRNSEVNINIKIKI